MGRKVLFKGTDYVDQLHKIVGVLGLPQDTSFWDKNASESVIDYIKNLRDTHGQRPPAEPIDFAAQFPECSPEGIDLLKQLLHLDPSCRITANEALEHPFVEQMRDPAEEIDCPDLFDFESFELIEDEHALRQCIVREVLHSKGRSASLRVPSFHSMDEDSRPRRRYTGSSISTPQSASATEAHLNAMAAIQQGKDIAVRDTALDDAQGMIMGSEFVGEPEDMDEDDFKLMDSDDSIRMDHNRRLFGPSNANRQELERHLSRDW